MNIALSGNVGENGEDLEDKLNAIIEGRKMVKMRTTTHLLLRQRTKRFKCLELPLNSRMAKSGIDHSTSIQ